MDWNFKFGILQGAFYLPFLFISILHVPIAVSQSTFLNDPTINPSNGSLIFGSSQTLNCSVLGNPQPSVSWYRANQTVLTGITTSTISFGTAVRVDSLFTFTVAIVDNQRSIKCKVNNSASNELVVTAVFNVKATPSMVLSGPGNYIINGSNTNIQHVCVAMNGFPKPSLSFYLNNTKLIGNTDLSSTNGDYTYNVQSTILWLPTLIDSGKLLKCQDSVSGNEKSMLITVQQIPSLSIGSSYSGDYGASVTLVCSVLTAVPQVSSYSWKKSTSSPDNFITYSPPTGRSTIQTSANSQSLTISNLQSGDAGRYKCVGTSAIGFGESNIANLILTGNVPTVVIPQASYSILAGNDLTIPCSISGTPTASNYSWTFTSASTSASLTIWNTNTKYTLASLSNPSLTILNLAPSDNGTYRCEAYNVAGKGTDSTQVIVTGSVPVVNIQNTQYSVLTGDSITIPCTISSSPSYTSAYWSFQKSNGQSLNVTSSSAKYTFQTTSSGTSLTVLNSNAADAGTYLCIASNLIGPSQDSALLAVTGSVPVLSIPQSSYSVTKTLNVTIPCSLITSTPPLQSVRWEFKPDFTGAVTNISIGGQFSGATTAGPSLTIAFANVNNQGSYRCVGINTVGEGKSGFTNLTVTGSVPSSPSLSTALVNVIKGNNTQVVCTSTGNPPPTIAWSFNGQIIAQGQTLSLNNVQKSDRGTYTCTATNVVGSVQSTLTVNVQYAPINANTQTSYTVIAGQGVTLTCNTDANPPSTYRWTNPGGVLIASTQNVTVSTTDTGGFGTYTCTATNSLGSLNVDFVVTKSTTGGSIGASTVASGGLSSGEIAAVVLAILLLVILIIVICFCCFSHGVCGVICGKKESKAAVEPVKEKEVIKEKEFVIPRFHEESIKGKRQPSAVSRKDVDVKVNHYRNENDYEIIRYENVAPAATTLGTIVSVPEEHREPRPHRLPQMNYTYEEEERRRKHRRKKKKRRKHQKRESEDVVVETVRRPSPVRYVEEEVIGEVVRPSPPVRYVDDAGEDVVVERVIRRNPSPSRIYRPEPEQPVIIETVRRSHSASPNPGRRHIYQDEGEEVIITERSLSRSPSRRRREERYVTEERIVNGDVIHDPDDMDLRAYDGVVVREPRLSRHGSGRYHVESERRQHRNRSRKYDDDDDDYGPEVVQGREYILDK